MVGAWLFCLWLGVGMGIGVSNAVFDGFRRMVSFWGHECIIRVDKSVIKCLRSFSVGR